MKLKLIALLIFSFSYQILARAPGTYYGLGVDLQKVSRRNISTWMSSFVKESMPSRMVGEAGHPKARDFITDMIKRLDTKKSGALTVSSTPADIEMIQQFYQKDFDRKVVGKLPKESDEFKKWDTFTQHMKNLAKRKKEFPVENIVWEKQGINSDKVLVVAAHYDTISHDKKTLLVNEKEEMPGANFNASGVAVALGLIRVLAEIDLNYSVQIVFLDWQGIGFHGSHLYAQALQKSNKEILGVINLEMLGHDTSFLDKTKKTGNLAIYLRDQEDEKKWATLLTKHGQMMTKKVDFELRPNGLLNSDHFRFWDEGIKTVTFSQNWEDDFNPKFYQTPIDTPETINHETLYFAYQYVGGAVISTLLDLTK